MDCLWYSNPIVSSPFLFLSEPKVRKIVELLESTNHAATSAESNDEVCESVRRQAAQTSL